MSTSADTTHRPATTPGEGSGFFYPTPELNQNLDLLHHLVENSDRIPLLKGPDGVGKSLLLEQFGQQAGPNWRTCRIDANLMLQPDQLFSALTGCFGVPSEGPRLSDRLTRKLEDLQQDGWLPVVMVDDAQLLPLDTLAALLQLYEGRLEERILFRLVLFASPAIDDLLRALQTRGVSTRSLQELLLLPLNREQTRRMIQQFVQLKGLAGQGFRDGQLERVARDSGGLPGEALKLAATRLGGKQAKPAAKEEKVELKLPSGLSWTTLLGGGVVLLVVVLTLVFQDRINALFEGERSDRDLLLLLPQQGRERVVPLQREQPSSGQVATNTRGGGEADRVRPENPEPVMTLPGLPGGKSAADEASAPVDGALAAAVTVETKPTPSPAGASLEAGSKRVPDERRQPDANPEAAAPEVADDKPAPRNPPPMVTRPLPVPLAGSPAPAKAPHTSEPAAAPRQANPPPATSQTPAPPAPRRALAGTGAGVQSESWLLRQKPTAYTLQLIGVRGEQAVKQFIQKNGLRGEVAYFRTQRDGRPWFSVVYGIYPDRAAALAARHRLPGGQGRSDAWPRTLGSIQQLIRSQKSE